MRANSIKRCVAILSCCLAFYATKAQVSITVDGHYPHDGAMLEVTHDSLGLLGPRVLDTSVVQSPVEGLQVYCTGCSPKGLYIYDGTSWNVVIGSSAEATYYSTEQLYCFWVKPDGYTTLVVNDSDNSSELYGSNDGTTWTMINDLDGADPGDLLWIDVTTYKYLKIAISANDSYDDASDECEASWFE